MKKLTFITRFCLLSITIAILGSVIIAQQKSKADLLKEVATLSQSSKSEDKAKAYELGKEYVSRFGTDTDENTGKVKAFVSGYREDLFYKAVDAKQVSDTFKLGNEIVAAKPDDVSVYMNMAWTGFNAISSGKSVETETLAASANAVKLINDGKAPANWAPFANKEESLGWLYYFQAIALQKSDMRASAVAMYKSTSHNSPVKTSMDPYYLIAFHYEQAYEKMSKELNAKISGRSISGDAEKAERARIEKCVDLMLDAYARAYKYAESGNNPKLAEVKDRYMQIYKFRKGSDSGASKYYAGIDSTPMPDPATFN